MFSTLPLAFNILIWTLCVLPAQAWFWNRNAEAHHDQVYKQVRRGAGSLQTSYYGENKSTDTALSGWNASTSRTAQHQYTPGDHTLSLPSPSVIQPTITSQSMIVTSINPLYEVCNIPGENPASCSLVFQTSTLTSCSAVVTGFFTRITVSDCEQSITFSSQTNYSVATATVVPSASAAIIAREAASLTTYVESVVSYYIAPWQSLISNDPSGITVVICTTNYVGEKCIQVQEVWVVYTEYVPVVLTSQISISQSFSSPVILLFGPSNSLTVTAGDLDFSTQIEYTSTSANATTVTSTIESQAFSSADTNSLAERASTANYTPVQSVVPYSRVTSTRTKTRTIFVTKGTTITKILDSTSTEDPTTTLVSTTTLTKTRTIRIQTA